MADTGSVSGTVFLDRNGNGLREPGESGFAGVGVMLVGKKADGHALYSTTSTDKNGNYTFAGSSVGNAATYTVTTGGTPLAAFAPTTYHPLRTIYVARDGNDMNPGTMERPFRTIHRALGLLEAGVLLYLRAGEYRERLSTLRWPLPGGISWEKPLVIAGYPGETTVIKPPDGGSEMLVNLSFRYQRHMIFDNLVFDGEDTADAVKTQSRDGVQSPPSFIRVINCEVKNCRCNGIITGGDYNQIINCRIHDNGHTDKDHGIYMGTGHNLVQGCDVYFNSGWGLHLYNGSEPTTNANVVRGNRIHDNSRAGPGAPGIGLYTGTGNLVYENLIWGNHDGIDVTMHGDHQMIFNNTIHGNRGAGINIESDATTGDNVVKNNILFANGRPILNQSKSSVFTNNLLDVDPKFRNAAALDFHLLPDSPAIGAGVAVAELTTDFDGNPRPPGTHFDVGAYQFTETGYRPTTVQKASTYTSGTKVLVDIGFIEKRPR